MEATKSPDRARFQELRSRSGLSQNCAPARVLTCVLTCVLALCAFGVAGCGQQVEPFLEAADARVNDAGATLVLVEETALTRKYALTFAHPAAAHLECFIRVPRDDAPGVPEGDLGPLPAVFFLAGFETGRGVLDLIDERHPAILISMNYPAPPGTGSGPALETMSPFELRAMAYRTLEGSVHVLDYLARRPDVDGDRIILLGVSFGSLFVVPLGAYDPRPDAVVVVFGGGDLPRLAEENLEDAPPWLPPFAVPLATRILFGELEPLKHAPRIAPRPLWMVSSPQDTLFPPESADALFAAANDPKKHLWFDAGHMDLFSAPVLREVTSLIVGELQSAGLLGPAQASVDDDRP